MPPETKKDPGIAALISVLGLLLLSAPAVGYFYLGEIRRGILYLLALWVIVGGILFVYLSGTIISYGLGGICCAPILVVPLILGLAIVYDVYTIAKGEPAKLPSI